MESIETGVEIAAPAADVRRALSTTEGLRGWWTTDCEVVRPGPGGEAVFRFDPGPEPMEVTFRIDRDGAELLDWSCIANRKNPDWQDTRLSFRLAPAGAGTRVELAHSRWREKTKTYEMCVGGWSHFLQSLKSYVETGTGTPHRR